MAYGATEPEAGSDLAALAHDRRPPSRRTARVVGYRLNGRKQWISNGGVAEVATILALAPGGPSAGSSSSAAPRASVTRRPEDKHGIRLSATPLP